MLKTPRFLLTASLALALVFTFSCSGDDGDSPPATLPSSSDAGVSQLPSSPSAALSSSSEDATLSSSSNDEELVEVSSSSEEEIPVSSSSSATPPPYIPPYNPPYIPPNPPVVPSSSSSLEHCSHFIEGTEIEHYGMFKKKFCDKRDGNEYVYVEIGEQTWMAENLNYAAEGSKCYDDDEEHCKTYGRLYEWETAMNLPGCNDHGECPSLVEWPNPRGICPEGWHIPFGASHPDNSTASGWTALRTYVWNNNKVGNNNNMVGYALKAEIDLWGESYTNNTDVYGFSALPAGYYAKNLSVGETQQGLTPGFNYLKERARWWMASIPAIGGPSYQQANTSNNAAAGNSPTSELHSVRCMKND